LSMLQRVSHCDFSCRLSTEIGRCHRHFEIYEHRQEGSDRWHGSTTGLECNK
jgi:hypothetical protein